MFTLRQEITWPYPFVIEFNGKEIMYQRPLAYSTRDNSPKDVLKHPDTKDQYTLLTYMIEAANEKLRKDRQ
jgi:hypothetical protein